MSKTIGDRAVDAEVAERVLGWQACHDPECEGCDAPVIRDGVRAIASRPDEPEEAFQPTADANDDFAVLRHVRETWSKPYRDRCYEHWRWRLRERDPHQIPLPMKMQEGDWAGAALAALDEMEEKR